MPGLRDANLHKLRKRLAGLPRTIRELDQTLVLLAYLRRRGWQDSLDGLPVDGRGEPRPWWCYGFVAWLEPLLRATDRVLEYGSGGSTLWLAERVSAVASVESDPAWADRVRRLAPRNVDVTCAAAAYAEAGLSFDAPDIVVVDGVDRPSCIRAAAGHVAEGGLIVVDDSERLEYAEALAHLERAGFVRVSFWGLRPGVAHEGATSAFFKLDGSSRWLGAPKAELA